MRYLNTTLTRGTANMLIQSALQWKAMHPGEYNERVEFALLECAKNDDGKALINLCCELLEGIERQRRNANDGAWSWEKELPENEFTDDIIKWIARHIGCWVDYNTNGYVLHTDQNHPNWRTP